MPQLPYKPTIKQLVEAYDEGFEGWLWNKDIEREWDEYWQDKPELYGINADIKDLHKKYPRVLLWQYRLKFDPRAWHEEAQTTGDCVSHGSRNARDITRSVEIARGDAEAYHRRGATEPTYGARGHGGQGMDPTRATKFEMEYGFLFREVYKDANKGLNLDLSKYNSTIGTNWGRTGVPEAVKDACKSYQVGDCTRAKTKEEAFDLFAGGFAAHSGQSWGTGSKTGKDGINRKSASWSHDMASGGYDLSCEFFKIPVVFVFNSWEDWNEPNPIWMANQDVYGPWVPGAIVMDAEEWERYFVAQGSIQFYSEIKGFPVKELPSMVSGVL